MIEDTVSAIKTLGRDDMFVVQSLALVTRRDLARKPEVMFARRFSEFKVMGHGRGKGVVSRQ